MPRRTPLPALARLLPIWLAALVIVLAPAAILTPPANAGPAKPDAARIQAAAGAQQSTDGAATSGKGRGGAGTKQAPTPVDPGPLAITIDNLSPATLPAKGRVTISGQITNTDEEEWRDINIYPVISPTPIVSMEELNAAASTDPDLYVGDRLLAAFETIGDLAPGQTAPYVLRVPVRLLAEQGVSTLPGVYWLAVHALGANSEGHDDFNDGKARTFIPRVDGDTDYLGNDLGRLDLAMILQLRRRVAHTAEGRVSQEEAWAADLAPGGRLRSLLDFGAAAGDRSLTWLVDPAVSDAVLHLMRGNQPRLVAGKPEPDPESPSETPSESPEDPTASPEPEESSTAAPDSNPAGTDPPAATGTNEQVGDPASIPANAEAWLTRLRQSLSGKQILSLPYGDVDASAASREHIEYLRSAQRAGTNAVTELGLASTRAVASPNGYLAPTAPGAAMEGSTVIVSDRATDGSGVVTLADPVTVDRRIIVTSSSAVAGGPGPDAQLAMVALRQRLLSEAALRLLTGDTRPLVVMLPRAWSPDAAATAFFEGLDQDWLNLADLNEINQTPTPAPELNYPEHQTGLELDPALLDTADDLTTQGDLLQSVLPANAQIGTALTRDAFADTSYGFRTAPDVARRGAEATTAWVNRTLGRIDLVSVKSVTLTGASGRFPLTIHNQLPVPVTVAVQAEKDDDLQVDLPGAITIDPGERYPLRPVATTTRIGAHNLTLTLTNEQGQPISEPLDLPVRSSQASAIIWLVMIGGAVIFFGVGGYRHLKRRNSTKAPAA